jgi:hypothetical protein
MSHRKAKREAQRTQNNREELVEQMARAVPEDGSFAQIAGEQLRRALWILGGAVLCVLLILLTRRLR